MRDKIHSFIDEHFGMRKQLMDNVQHIEEAVQMITSCFKGNHKVLIMGNGGSAADSQHFAAELVGRYKLERKGLPAIALTTDTSILTSISNDYGFDRVFEKQITALAQEGDVVIGITTSGNSANILNALEAAKKAKSKTIVLNGKDGGILKGKADVEILMPIKNTPRVQEAHILCIHMICEIVEEALYA